LANCIDSKTVFRINSHSFGTKSRGISIIIKRATNDEAWMKKLLKVAEQTVNSTAVSDARQPKKGVLLRYAPIISD
jgi:hypothetical protein